MRARLRQFIADLDGAFWLLPATLVIAGLALGEGLVDIERAGLVWPWLLKGWLYSGGGGGARTLLGAVASSTIGVAGTVFSITIASLTLASSQMGPRLLDNFTRDRGNQFTLGFYLGTFTFAVMVLRAVRSANEGEFVPHLAVTAAIALAFGCVALLVYFVHHMAGRINVDTVIELVHQDLRRSLRRLTLGGPDAAEKAPAWAAATTVASTGHGYLQQLDDGALADWAERRGVSLRLAAKPGDYIFPGVPLLSADKPVEGLGDILAESMVVGGKRVGSADLEFCVRQLVDVAVRALSPGINDPQTAIGALDRLAAVLCELAGRYLPTGIFVRGGQVVYARAAVTYDGLVDAMFTMIRQNAETSPAVIIHLLDVLAAVASAETNPERLHTLERHADLALAAPGPDAMDEEAQGALKARYDTFCARLASHPLLSV